MLYKAKKKVETETLETTRKEVLCFLCGHVVFSAEIVFAGFCFLLRKLEIEWV